MKGYRIKEELYASIGHRTTACTLVLNNGYEITGVHCLDLSDMIHEEGKKQKAFQDAYRQYEQIVNAYQRERIYGNFPLTERKGVLLYEKESV